MSPSWSPDGRRIAFQSDVDEDWEIFVMNADGSGVTQLTDNEAWNLTPSWSPDGRRIAFQSLRDGDREIYVMNADGFGREAADQQQGSRSVPQLVAGRAAHRVPVTPRRGTGRYT